MLYNCLCVFINYLCKPLYKSVLLFWLLSISKYDALKWQQFDNRNKQSVNILLNFHTIRHHFFAMIPNWCFNQNDMNLRIEKSYLMCPLYNHMWLTTKWFSASKKKNTKIEGEMTGFWRKRWLHIIFSEKTWPRSRA